MYVRCEFMWRLGEIATFLKLYGCENVAIDTSVWCAVIMRCTNDTNTQELTT